MFAVSPARTCSTLLAILLSLPALKPAAAGPRLALVVGNSRYPSPWELPACANDADRMAKWLLSVGYRPAEILLRKDLERNEMLAALRSLRDEARRKRPEQVVVFYSGHGTTIEDDDGDEPPGDRTDEAFAMIGDYADLRRAGDALVRDDEFYRYIGEIAQYSDNVVLLIDACHAGGLLKNPGEKPAASGQEELGKVKAIPEVEWTRRIAPVNTEPASQPRPERQASRSGPDHRAGGGRAPEVPLELGIPEKCSFFFVAAARQDQSARAGSDLSHFTRVYLDLVRPADSRLAGQDEPLTLELLRRELVKRLEPAGQTPVVLAFHVQEPVRWIGDVFSDLRQVEETRLANHQAVQRLDPAGHGEPLDAAASPWRTVRAMRWQVLTIDDATRATVASRPTQVFRTGRPFAVRIEAFCDLWIYVLSVAPRGEPQLLLPAEGEDHLLVRKGESVQVPPDGQFRFVDGPAVERFRIIASPLRLSLLNPKLLASLSAAASVAPSPAPEPQDGPPDEPLVETLRHTPTAQLLRPRNLRQMARELSSVAAPRRIQFIVPDGEDGQIAMLLSPQADDRRAIVVEAALRHAP